MGTPTLYNPVVSNDPFNGLGRGEPVFDPRTVPGKVWENKLETPVGRTVEFGKIET